MVTEYSPVAIKYCMHKLRRLQFSCDVPVSVRALPWQDCLLTARLRHSMVQQHRHHCMHSNVHSRPCLSSHEHEQHQHGIQEMNTGTQQLYDSLPQMLNLVCHSLPHFLHSSKLSTTTLYSTWTTLYGVTTHKVIFVMVQLCSSSLYGLVDYNFRFCSPHHLTYGSKLQCV